MKKIIVGIGLATLATFTWANCTYQNYFINGKSVSCTVCCTQFGCTTTCY